MKAKTGTLSRKTKRTIFYILGMAWPVVWFLVFYVYLNSSNIVQAFLTYDIEAAKFSFYGMNNFVNVIKNVSQEYVLRTALKNSILVYFIGWIAGFTVGQIFSYTEENGIELLGLVPEVTAQNGRNAAIYRPSTLAISGDGKYLAIGGADEMGGIVILTL